MSGFVLSKHAEMQFKRRGIDRSLLEEVLVKPQRIIEVELCIHVYQSLREVNQKNYLVRIFVNICRNPVVIVTGYLTSKIDKYYEPLIIGY